MGVVCCESSPKLTHEDDPTVSQQDPSASSMASASTLPSDHAADRGNPVPLKPAPSVPQAQDTVSAKINKNIKPRPAKKGVRISDEVTLIPLLTSGSFFRKTPKPVTITSHSYGIMPSFRIVTPAAIAASTNSKDDISDSDSQEKDRFVPKSSLWWTKEERREILQANQKASRDFKRFQPTKIRQANLVYKDIVADCCQSHHDDDPDDDHLDDEDIYDFFQRQRLHARTVASSTNSTAITNTNTSTSHASTKKRKRADCAPSVMGDFRLPPSAMPDTIIDLPTHVRGLEWGVMPDAKRYRKTHAKTVLRWQDRFRRMNEKRRRRRRNHDDCEPLEDHWNSTESSSSSSSSSDDEDDESVICFGGDSQTLEERSTREQQALLLGSKASISSQRSTLLARVFGNSDAMATASDLEDKRSSTGSPTPSLTGTSESSSGSDNDSEASDSDDSEDESDTESDSENDSDQDDEESRPPIFFQGLSHRSGYSSTSLLSSNANANSHRRMFRPRMMPPTSWR